MIDSDDKTTDVSEPVAKLDDTTDAPRTGSGAVLVTLGIKVVAIALSVVILILCILTVAMPFSAMRVFNNLGMNERALTSAERYVNGRMRGYTAEDGKRGDYVDGDGNYSALAAAVTLIDDEFVEALDLCITLSDRLMTGSEKSGDTASAVHFAHKLEKYTRVFASMYNNRDISASKDAFNVANTPIVAAKPYVSDYLHTVYTLNFRARVRTGETGRMLFDYGQNGRCTILTDAYSTTFVGIDKTDTSFEWFIDYLGQLDEYLYHSFSSLGITKNLTEYDFMLPDASDPDRGKYHGLQLNGDEFALFVTPADGFTNIYENLRNFSEWAQYCVNYNATTTEQKLFKLQAANVISSVHMKLWQMSMLLNASSNSFGVHTSDVRNEYGKKTCENYGYVEYGGTRELFEGNAYRAIYNDYASLFAAN